MNVGAWSVVVNLRETVAQVNESGCVVGVVNLRETVEQMNERELE